MGMEKNEEYLLIKDKLLDDINSFPLKDIYYNDMDETSSKNTFSHLVNLISGGGCRIILENCVYGGYNLNVRYLDIENGYNYHLQINARLEAKTDSLSYSGHLEIKKISFLTQKSIDTIILSIGLFKESIIMGLIDFAELNEDMGNSIKLIMRYSEVRKVDSFETEFSKYVSKESRLRKINSIIQ
jgi:hypothetical protein